MAMNHPFPGICFSAENGCPGIACCSVYPREAEEEAVVVVADPVPRESLVCLDRVWSACGISVAQDKWVSDSPEK